MRIQQVSHFYAQLGVSKIQNISSRALAEKNIRLDIKRDDLLHPVVSGNKWRKLKHILIKIEAGGYRKIAVMGGPYSNLLHSLSYLAMLLGWQIELYVRGYPEQKLTPMLTDAIKWGAKIKYVDRVHFRKLRNNSPKLNDDVFWITEGGYEQLAVKGSVESLMEINKHYDYLLIACATGTSLAGYCQGVAELSLNTQVIGISVLKNDDEIARHLNKLTDGKVKPEIISGYEFGGYAKSNTILNEFIKDFKNQHNITLEPVYSGKSFYAVMDLINSNYFKKDSRILLIHCGGLQALRLF